MHAREGLAERLRRRWRHGFLFAELHRADDPIFCRIEEFVRVFFQPAAESFEGLEVRHVPVFDAGQCGGTDPGFARGGSHTLSSSCAPLAR